VEHPGGPDRLSAGRIGLVGMLGHRLAHAARISAATWSAGPRPSASVTRFRLLTTTRAPCQARARQNDRPSPSPRPPPDTTATSPASGVSLMIAPSRIGPNGPGFIVTSTRTAPPVRSPWTADAARLL
jgi:hypothetical protein